MRQHTGEVTVEAVLPVMCTPAADGQTCVELLAGTSRWCVHVTVRACGQSRLTSCAGHGTYGSPSSYELVSIRRIA